MTTRSTKEVSSSNVINHAIRVVITLGVFATWFVVVWFSFNSLEVGKPNQAPVEGFSPSTSQQDNNNNNEKVVINATLLSCHEEGEKQTCESESQSSSLLEPSTTLSSVEENDDFCGDEDESCLQRAHECSTDTEYMRKHCKRTCGLCDASKCTDGHRNCEYWASVGECDANPNYMLRHCSRSCDSCAIAPPNPATEGQQQCQDKISTQDCMVRKRNGDCDSAPGWMTVFCGNTCGRCHLMAERNRCRPEVFQDESYVMENAFKKPGDVDAMFRRILRDYPHPERIEVVHENPWIIKIRNFTSDEEMKTLLSTTLPNVKRSTDQGSKVSKEGIQEQVVSTGRTSFNAWCMHGCSNHPVVQNLTSRISSLLEIPSVNFESYQVLQYRDGQKYDVHHDSSQEDERKMAGPRVLTFFMYFSDVEEGGETFFNKLGIKVKPERGAAVLWPSVLDEDPVKIDQRTTHAALPVIKGEKLAANAWIHSRDFMTPNKWGCTGNFN